MIKTKLFKQASLLLVVIAILDVVATIFYLHWTVWWFDTILHFLGGAWSGITVILIWHHYHNKSSNQLKMVFIGVSGALIIGLLWEIYELLLGATSFSDGIAYLADTASDIIMDICGSFFGALYSIKIIRNHS